MRAHGPEYYNCTCPICRKQFHLKPSRLKKIKTNSCCSKECYREWKRIQMSGEKNHQFGLKGDKNPTWTSDRHLSRYGYWQIRSLDHPFRDQQDFVLEHRLVAEQYLLTDENSVEIDGKRYLSPDYVVHHIDFNRLNNDPSNLVVMTKGEHQSFHAKLNPRPRGADGQFLKGSDILRAKRTTATALLPVKATDGSACYDLFVDIDSPVVIRPHETTILQTHIALEIPSGYCGLVFARSGISSKRYLRPATCVSVIDSDYRGSVGLPIHNDGDIEQTIQPHERVAQLMLVKSERFDISLVENLDCTERGSNGFGSTGF